MVDSEASKKRKHDSQDDNNAKRVKLAAQSGPSINSRPNPGRTTPLTANGEKERVTEDDPVSFGDTESKKRPKINKLAPKRPYPTVPTSESATGPRSAHKQGKNCICLTRKTKLSSYMRRCKDIILKDGYKTLHLSAMGAAIPHLLLLVAALPPILPYAREEIKLDIITDTVELQDEILPENEDEDISYQSRNKSALHVTMKIGDGEFEGSASGGRSARRRPGAGRFAKRSVEGKVVVPEPEQPEQEEREML